MTTSDGAASRLLHEIRSLLARIDGEGVAGTRQAIAGVMAAPVLAGRRNAVVGRHLPAALQALSGTEPGLAQAIADAAPFLPWQTYDEYPAAEIGPDFGTSHAFASLIGQANAVWPAAGIDIGLFLMAPHLLYRDHAHPAPELYLPLTGPHRWRFRPGAPFAARPAFDPVWVRPLTPHATLVGEVPFLCLYAWLDHPEAPAHIVWADDWSRHET